MNKFERIKSQVDGIKLSYKKLIQDIESLEDDSQNINSPNH